MRRKSKSAVKAEETYTQENPKEAWKPSGPKRVYNNSRNGNRRSKGSHNANGGDRNTQPHYAGSNDVRWYARTDELLQNVGRLSFNYPAGSDIPYLLSKEAGFANLPTGSGVWINPGVMAIGLVPTYGISDANSSPVNVAFKQSYNRIRMENSGGRNYDHTDLGKYYIGVDSLFMFYALLVRAYGLLNNYNYHNKYLPRALVFASGFDYDDLVMNSPNFLNYINNYAKRLTAFMAPKDMPIFTRHFTMFSSIYKDTESPRSQFYLYTPAVLYKYKADAQPGESLFTNIYLYNNAGTENSCAGLTFEQIVQIGDDLINAMDDQDMITMSGDILKAYGEAGVWTQGVLTPDYTVNPIFDFTWLTQVQNLTSLNINTVAAKITDGVMDPYTGSTNNPYIMKEVIPNSVSSPYLTMECSIQSTHGPSLAHKSLLVSPYDSPTPGDVMESTRLILGGTSVYNSTAGKWIDTVTDCASEIVVNLHVINFLGVGTTNILAKRPIVTSRYWQDGSTTPVLGMFLEMVELDNFAMHPIVYLMTHPSGSTDVSSVTLQPPFVDLDNYAMIGLSEIHNLHAEAMLSLLFSGNVGGAGRI